MHTIVSNSQNFYNAPAPSCCGRALLPIVREHTHTVVRNITTLYTTYKTVTNLYTVVHNIYNSVCNYTKPAFFKLWSSGSALVVLGLTIYEINYPAYIDVLTYSMEQSPS
jgi:hypothetical protein